MENDIRQTRNLACGWYILILQEFNVFEKKLLKYSRYIVYVKLHCACICWTVGQS